MNIDERPAQNLRELRGGDDAFHGLTLHSPLNVTVIATTERGTTAALDEARRLAQDLNARITLLKIEVVPTRFPLDKSPVSLDATTRRQCSLALESSSIEQDVTIRSCLCRDRDFSLQRIFRRRALIVIGGRRHWWLSREEKLEKVLRSMGHHVIFVELDSKANWTRQGGSSAAFRDRTSQSRKKVGTTESLLGSEALRRNDAGRLINHAQDISVSSAPKGW
jgi:hypothetical protein